MVRVKRLILKAGRATRSGFLAGPLRTRILREKEESSLEAEGTK